MENHKILIVGTGALATLFAARCAATGIQTKMLGSWPEALAVLSTKGARIEGEKFQRVQATACPEECAPADLVLVLVKSWKTEFVATQLRSCLTRDGLVVSLQNGLNNDKILTRVLTPDDYTPYPEDHYLIKKRVATGVTTLGALLIAPGLVRPTGEGTIWLESHPSIDRLSWILRRAGFHVEIQRDIQPWVWGKLVVNAAINPLTAVLRIMNGELLSDPQARKIMGILVQEAGQVAEAQGIILPFKDGVKAAEEIAQKTRENYSSMYMDVQREEVTEIEAINGEIIRIGEQLGLSLPVNCLLRDLVLKKVRLTSSELSDMVRLKWKGSWS